MGRVFFTVVECLETLADSMQGDLIFIRIMALWALGVWLPRTSAGARGAAATSMRVSGSRRSW